MSLTNISAGTTRTGPLNQNELGNDRTTDTGRVGRLEGHTVQQAATAHAPAAPSGIGKRIADFFTATLPGFFSAARNAVLSLFRPAGAAPAPQAVRPTTPKPIAEFTFPGDCYAPDSAPTEKKYPVPSNDVARGAAYATARYFASTTAIKIASGTDGAGDARGAFLRSNYVATAKLAVAEGAPMAGNVRSIVLDAFDGKGPTAFLDASYDTKASNYQAICGKDDHGVDADAAARDAVATAEKIYEAIFGTPGDQSSIDAAASRVPQGLCDALAIGLKAIDDANIADNAVAKELKDKLATDMIALRVVNPAITNAIVSQPGQEAMGDTMRRNILEFSKFVQNIANGVPMGRKEAIHPAASQALADNNTQGRLQATFKAFTAAVVARADASTVAAAAADGVRMAADFDAEQVRQGKAPDPASISGDDASSALSNSQDALSIGTDGTFIPVDQDEDIFTSPFADDGSVSNDEDVRRSPFA
jgi:hypothetical protein